MRRFRGWFCLAAGAAVFMPAGSGPPPAPGELFASPTGKPAATEAAVPFRVGEHLDYRVSWANLETAATAHLAVTERRMFYLWTAWHFQAVAHTADPLRYLIPLDDQFDSYADATTLTSHQYELYLRENGKLSTRIVRLLAEREPAWGSGPEVLVRPGTRDPVSMLYYLRAVDWHGVGEVSSPVYDGAKLYRVRARLQTPEASVTVPAGTYTTSVIDIRVYSPDQSTPEVRCWVWLAEDPARSPVRIDAEIPVGTVRAELLKAVE